MINAQAIKPQGFRPGTALERLEWTFYDSSTIATATALDTDLFASGQGSRTPLLCNLPQGGQMTEGKEFHVTALRIGLIDADARDVKAFINNALVRFHVGDKDYFQAPAFACPAGWGTQIERLGGAALAATPANDVFSGLNGMPSLNNARQFRIPVPIVPRQNFGVQIKMAAQTLIATITFYAMLDGILLRPAINNVNG